MEELEVHAFFALDVAGRSEEAEAGFDAAVVAVFCEEGAAEILDFDALDAFAEAFHVVDEAGHEVLVGVGPLDEVALDGEVVLVIEEVAETVLAVAAGSADFLVIGLEGAGDLVVDEESDVFLVDSHAEGVCREDETLLAFLEGDLLLFSFFGGKFAVVDHGVDPSALEDLFEGFKVFDQGEVDDAGAFHAVEDFKNDFLFFCIVLHDGPLEKEVRALDAGVEDGGFAQG